MLALTTDETQEFERLLVLRDSDLCSGSLARFVKGAWSVLEPSTPLVWNWHLDTLCAYMEAFRERRIKRIVINIPPGAMKSLLVSVMYPAWVWTVDPGHRIIGLSNEESLATRDNLKMRNLVLSEWYKERWGHQVLVSSDQREKTHFANQKHGFRMSLGIKANVTGKRGNTLVIDDPLDAKKAFSDVEALAVNQSYDQAVNTRLNQPNEDGIAIIMQRLRTNDLSGHVLAKKATNWVHVCIPMRYEGSPGFDPVKDLGAGYARLADPRRERGELLWEERFNASTLAAMEEDLGEYGTAGQLQQRPVPLSGGILKPRMWRVWGEEKWTKGLKPPFVKHVFVSLDTAYTEKDLKENSYTAMTAWGVFWDADKDRDALLMLGRWFERVAYSSLKEKTVSLAKDYSMKAGDAYLVEKKASGISLLQDLRSMHRKTGMQVRSYDPGPDGDKVARAYLAEPMLKAGLLWIPQKLWAKEIIDIVSEFPAGGPPCADLTDTITQAALYLKRRHWLTHPDDETDVVVDSSAEEKENWRHDDNTPQRRGYG